MSFTNQPVEMIEIHKEKINWINQPKTVDLLEIHKEKINWKLLSENPNAIRLLEEEPEEWIMVEQEDPLGSSLIAL